MNDGRPLLDAGSRVALLGRLARLTLDDLRSLDAAVRDLATRRELRGRVEMGFWFAWQDGVRLREPERAELGALFSDVMAAVASGLTGLDLERFGGRLGGGGGSMGGGGGMFGGIRDALRVRTAAERRQETAIGLINDAAAPWDPRLGLVACWNLACAAALRRHAAAATIDALEAPWRAALGDPPA